MNSMIQQNMMSDLQELQKNPVQYLLNRRLNIPNNIGNNPQAIANYLVQSGQVSPERLAQAKQMFGM